MRSENNSNRYFTGNLYGNEVLKSRLSYSKDYLKDYRKGIKTDLEKMGIDLSELKDKTVLDIGSGNQAIVFNELGAKEVTHLDISLAQVSSLKRYINANNLKNISSTVLDVIDEELPDVKFDIVYLKGVYHHFSVPSKFLVNIKKILNPGGVLYFLYYRSGSFDRFLNSGLRRMVKKNQLNKIKKYVYLHYGLSPYSSSLIQLFDDLFVEHCHSLAPYQFRGDGEKLGLEVINSSEGDSTVIYDHSSLKGFSIIILKNEKTGGKSYQWQDLSTKEGIDQLTDIDYCEDWINESIEMLNHYLYLAETGGFDEEVLINSVIVLFRILWPLTNFDLYNPDFVYNNWEKLGIFDEGKYHQSHKNCFLNETGFDHSVVGGRDADLRNLPLGEYRHLMLKNSLRNIFSLSG